jgi:PilZ domain
MPRVDLREVYRFLSNLEYRNHMVETRSAPRHRVLKAGTIEFGGGAIDCVVRNLSTTGAALEISSQVGIPERFALVVPGDGLHLHCDVVWRKNCRIGVAFG